MRAYYVSVLWDIFPHSFGLSILLIIDLKRKGMREECGTLLTFVFPLMGTRRFLFIPITGVEKLQTDPKKGKLQHTAGI